MKALRIISTAMIWISVLGISGIPATNENISSLIRSSPWLSRGTTIQLTILALSILLILFFSRGELTRYGFRKPSREHIRAALVFGSIFAVAVHIILEIIWVILPSSGRHPTLTGSSFIQILLSTWVLASISEEMLHRGLIQSFLEPLREHDIKLYRISISVPVLISAFLFGIMHIMLLTMGFDGYIVGGIVCSAMVLGIIAGYYREKSGSLLPAILVHMLFNAYGTTIEYIQQIVIK